MELLKQPSQSEIYDKVKIIVRVRPTLNGEDEKDFVEMIDQQTLNLLKPGNNIFMKFSDILPKSSKQDDVFKLTKESVDNLINGTNSTIFAYGQTGAGKTYTIIGDSQNAAKNSTVPSGKDRGVLIRTLEMVLSELELKKITYRFKLYISFFEIYNEKIYDLLNNKHIRSNSSLEIRESKNFEVQIPDLTNVLVTTFEECLSYLHIGLKNRATGSTIANGNSSRSHSIFQITLCKYTSNLEPIVSTLKIVDLAGSEKFQIEGFSNDSKELRIQELTSINGSLSWLGYVITALMDKSRKHIPFRNSKLTRVLSDSLSGNSKIYFIICISPSINSSSETISTLQFANRAKKAVLDGRNLLQNIRKNKENIRNSKKEEVDFLKVAYQKEKMLREEYERILKESNALGFKDEFNQLREENEKLKVKILEIQNIGKDNEMKVTRKHQAKIQAVMEKNLVLQKIKQSEFIPNKENIEDIEIFDSLPSIQEQNVFASKLFCEKKLSKQNMLSVSPSRNYLLNLENIEKVKYEYSPNTPFLDENIRKDKNRCISESFDLKDEMLKALNQLHSLQEKDKEIKMLPK